MAACEAISKVIVETIGNDLEVLDVRLVKLPHDRPQVTTFDPRDYRTPRVEIKPWMAYFNLLRNTFGTAILGASMIISQVGFIIGPLLIILTGLLVLHTHMVLLWCLNEISRQLHIVNISYRYGFRVALLHGPPCLHTIGRNGPFIIALFMVMSQTAICALLVLFTADNLRDIVDWESNIPAIFALLAPYFIMEIFMKNLRIISQVILAANILNLVGFILVIYHIVMKGREEGGDDLKLRPTGCVSVLNAFGTALFNLSAIGVVLSCEKALKHPQVMTKTYGVVRVGILVPTIVAVLVGTAGYYSFGGMEENILRYLPFDETTSIICIAFYMITTGLSYPLQCYPCIQIITEVVKNHDPYVNPSNACIKGLEYVCRPILVIITFLIAYCVPVQGPMVAFIGSFCTTLLVLVFPAMMEIGLCYPEDYGYYNYILIKDILIVLLGIISWFTGVYFCGYLIYVRLLSISPSEEYL